MRHHAAQRAATALLLLGLAFGACAEPGDAGGPPPAVCPDGTCSGDETSESCPADCSPASQCGDGTCDQAGGECESCVEDCPAGACEACGNGVCVASVESCASCAEDCGDCLACPESPEGAAPELKNAAICDFLDPAKCLLPFPNDFYLRDDPTTDTGKRVALTSEAIPKNVLGVPARPEEFNRGDGWSPVTALVTKVDGQGGVALDLERSGAPTILNMGRSLELDSPILVIDAETGERHPVWAELDHVPSGRTDQQGLLIRPGRSYLEGRRYIVALRNLVDLEGRPIPAGPGFRLYRDCLPHGEAVIEARRGPMEGIFAALAKVGVKRSELYLAWDFTIASARSLSGRLLHMRDESFASSGPIPVKDVKTGDPGDSPFTARVVTGAIPVPNYLTTPLPGGRLAYGPDGMPAPQPLPHDTTFTCIVPKSASASTPSRLAIYGHQILKSQAEVHNTNLQRLSYEHNITFCATDWIGMAQTDLPNIATILVDISNFTSLTDRLHQAHLNFLWLGRLLKEGTLQQHPAFRDAATGEPLVGSGPVYFFGEDQGGTLGAATCAVAQDWTDAVLSVAGMSYSSGMTRSINGKQFMDFASQSYPDRLDVTMGLQILQLPWDSTEGSGYVQHLLRDPYPGTPAKRVLMHEAFGDHSTPNMNTELLARSARVPIRTPALAPGRSLDVVPFFGIEPIESFPHTGSALFVWDSGSPPPEPRNVPPSGGPDPHAVPGSLPEMRALTAQFMGPGGITDVCEGVPCTPR